MVERGSGSVVATFFVESKPEAGATVALSEAAARHAQVRRIPVGDELRVVDGAGTIGYGTLASLSKRGGEVAVVAVEQVIRPVALTLVVPVADRERMLWLAEKATELAVTDWQPVMFARSRSVSPRGEGEAFERKVYARMVSALEQSSGAWLPTMHDVCSLDDAMSRCADAERYVLDQAGAAMPSFAPFGASAVVVGPEGGIEPDELGLLLARGWRAASLGGSILRFETAGVAAAAIIRASQGR